MFIGKLFIIRNRSNLKRLIIEKGLESYFMEKYIVDKNIGDLDLLIRKIF